MILKRVKNHGLLYFAGPSATLWYGFCISRDQVGAQRGAFGGQIWTFMPFSTIYACFKKTMSAFVVDFRQLLSIFQIAIESDNSG